MTAVPGWVNPSTDLNSTKNRSCLSSPQTAFPGGSAPRQLTSAGYWFTWLVRGLTLTTRRQKNRARASWRHLPSAFSVKPGFHDLRIRNSRATCTPGTVPVSVACAYVTLKHPLAIPDPSSSCRTVASHYPLSRPWRDRKTATCSHTQTEGPMPSTDGAIGLGLGTRTLVKGSSL